MVEDGDDDESSDRPARKRRRLTFAATTSLTEASAQTVIEGPTSSTRSRKKIICWAEQLGKDIALGDRIRMRTRPLKLDEGDSDRKIVHLGTSVDARSKSSSQTESETGPHLVAVFDDGNVYGWTESLAETSVLDGKSYLGHASKVWKATLVSLEQARRGILKGRDDLVGKVEGVGGSEILVILGGEHGAITSCKGMMMLYIFHFDSIAEDAATVSSGKSRLSLLQSVPVSETENVVGSLSEFWFDKSISTMFQRSEKGNWLVTYDLSNGTASRRDQIKLDKRVKSIRPLSSGAVAIVNGNLLSVIDTKYASALACGPLEDALKDKHRHKSTKNAFTPAQAQLLTYFSSMGIVVALHGRNLVTFRTGANSSDARNQKRTFRGTLADAVAHGSEMRRKRKHASKNESAGPIARLGDVLYEQPLGKDWLAATADLDEMIEAGNTDGVDRLVCETLGVKMEDQQELYLNDPPSKRLHIQFLLSKFFSLDKTTQTSPMGQHGVTAKIFPIKTMSWLAMNGVLTHHEIDMALKRYGAMQVVETLRPCAMIEALYNFDRSLQTLVFLFASSLVLSPVEVACAIKFALHVLQQAHDLSNSGNTNVKRTSAEPNDVEQMDLDPIHSDLASSEGAGPTDALVRARSPSPEPGADVAHDAHALIQHCLSRLHSTPQSALQAALTTALPLPSDLLALTEYLRLALARDGWFSRYLDSSAAKTSSSQERLPDAKRVECETDSYEGPEKSMFALAPAPIGATASLLNAAIDTLGTGGWLLQPMLPASSSRPPTSTGGEKGAIGDANGKTTTAIASTIPFPAPAAVEATAGTTLSHMRAEISAALEGVEEAAYLAGMLGEILLYSKTVPKLPAQEQQQISTSLSPNGISALSLVKASSKSKPITVIADTTTHVGDNALPLGLKASSMHSGGGVMLDAPDMFSVSGGGEVKLRSQRDVGRLKSMRVGKHTFERIII